MAKYYLIYAHDVHGPNKKQRLIGSAPGDSSRAQLFDYVTYDKQISDIQQAIRRNDIDGLSRYLDALVLSDNNYPEFEQAGNQMSAGQYIFEDRYGVHATSFMEYLFLNKRGEFKDIISMILTLKNPSFTAAAFVEAADRGIHPFLSKFDDSAQRILSYQVQQLKTHGLKLKTHPEDEEADTRGQIIEDLGADLSNDLAQAKSNFGSTLDNPVAKLKIIQFKLNFVEKMHSKDKEISSHRDKGVAIILANIASFLLTGFIANLVLKAKTGRWYFYKETQSEALVNNMQKTLNCENPLPSTRARKASS